MRGPPRRARPTRLATMGRPTPSRRPTTWSVATGASLRPTSCTRGISTSVGSRTDDGTGGRTSVGPCTASGPKGLVMVSAAGGHATGSAVANVLAARAARSGRLVVGPVGASISVGLTATRANAGTGTLGPCRSCTRCVGPILALAPSNGPTSGVTTAATPVGMAMARIAITAPPGTAEAVHVGLGGPGV